MAFFAVPRDEDISPEARQWLDELKRLRGVDTLPRSWVTYASSPQILKARVTAEANPSELQPEAFRELQAQGFSPTDVQEIARCAAHALMNTIFTTVANTALRED